MEYERENDLNQRRFPAAVIAAVLLAVVAGCANTDERRTIVEPSQLIGTAWRVEDISGGGVTDNSNTTVEFPQPGRVAGSTGCNRYSGTVTADGDEMSFGSVAGTRRACIPALGNQEVKFYSAMEKVTRWEVPDTGLLHLKDASGATVIRASRIED